MNRIITNWENDLIDEPESILSEFVKKKYPHYDLKLLSGLRHRDMQDIYDSLLESRVIIMQPSLLEENQVVEIVTKISHPIHGQFCGATREWDIRDFVFLSANPWEDLNEIKRMCSGKKDQVNEEALTKILRHCECHFFGFAGEHYELKSPGGFGDYYAIRYR